MMKRFWLLLACVMLATPATAQVISGPITISAQDAGACATANACASFDVTRMPAFTLEITGTWSGTLTFQCRSVGTYVNVVMTSVATQTGSATTTANGTFSSSNAGFDRCRVQGTTLGSGSAVVSLRSGALPIRSSVFTTPGANGEIVNTTLLTDTSATCTAANTTETDLWTYTLPAGYLNANGKGVRVTVFGSTAANTDTKTVRLYFAGSVIRTVVNSASNNETFYATAVIIRTGASAQNTTTTSGNASNFFINRGSTSGDTTTGLIVKITGQNGTAAANDICGYMAIVESLK